MKLQSSIIRKICKASFLCLALSLIAANMNVVGVTQGNGPGNSSLASSVSEAKPRYKDARLPVDVRVADLLKRMTIQEKARQLDMYSGAGDLMDKSELEDDSHAKPGAHYDKSKVEHVLGNLGAGSIHDLYPDALLYDSLQAAVMKSSRLGIPAIFIEEGLHGYCGLHKTVFPQSVNLASTWDPQLAREIGSAIGSEARADGVDMILAPVLDVAREPRWGRVEEDFGEDPFLSGKMGLAYVEGMQGKSLASDSTCIAEPKHFAGYGSPESGLNIAPTHAGEREVRSVMLKSFEPAIREGHAMAIMASYNSIDALPNTDSPWLLTQVLRKEWGFRGFVLSDLGAIRQLYNIFYVAPTREEAVYLALKAGVDMQFYDFPHDVFQNAIINGVKDGRLPESVVDSAVVRVLRAKFMLGLFDKPFIDPALSKIVSRFQEHKDLALEVARKSMCLLKNNNELLPLKKDLDCIAVIGQNLDSTRLGDYSSEVDDFTQESMLQQIKNTVSSRTRIVTSRGDVIDEAVQLAKQAKVVILGLGENSRISGENRDRSDLNLPGNQEKLLEAVVATGVPTILVLQNGRPLTISWAAENVQAILEAWYPGEFGGRAIAETLFGDNNPAGRLSITFPRSVGQLPDFYNYGTSKIAKYIDLDTSPLFPFGYGLSYTTFKYDSLVVTQSAKGNLEVSFELTNTGKRDGDEVAQVYVREEYASVETPVKSLKGFQRVHLRAGESERVTVNLKREDLSVWGAKNKWEFEPGKFSVMVGGNSEDLITKDIVLK